MVNLLRDTGRLSEALELAGQRAQYTRHAGLGPWNQLAAWRNEPGAIPGTALLADSTTMTGHRQREAHVAAATGQGSGCGPLW
jgi:hypothetical protein